VGQAGSAISWIKAWNPGARTYAQLNSHVGRNLVPPSAASERETGLESLLRVRVSAPSASPTRLQLGHCPHTALYIAVGLWPSSLAP
jgi:hypothetical protein